MGTRRIHTMRELDQEIRLGRERLAEIERTLGGNMDHLRENYRMMALRSVLGSRFVRSRTGIFGEVLLQLMGSEPLQDGLMSLIDKLGARFGRVFSRFRGRREPEGETPDRADGVDDPV